MERRGSGSAGYVIVLVGVVVFVVGCFLPYLELLPLAVGSNVSYFRLVIFEGAGAAANVGGFLLLFGGPAAIAWIAIAGIIRGSRSTRPALAAATVVWSLTWIGVLLGVDRLGVDEPRLVGWWVLLLGVVLVVIGTSVTWTSDRRAEGVSPAVRADRYVDFF